MGESLEAYYIPVSLSDLEAIQDIIQQHEIFCAPVPGVDLYKCLTWSEKKIVSGYSVRGTGHLSKSLAPFSAVQTNRVRSSWGYGSFSKRLGGRETERI